MYRIRSMDDHRAEYARSVADPEQFWAEVAGHFQWRKPWDRVLEWEFSTPAVKWYLGGKLNITENCLDRHLAARGDKTAIIWEPNDPDEAAQRISYRELHARVCRMANVLKANGARRGDRICIYMPMIPELAVAMLACARIGAIHSVVFGGFSARSLVDRIHDAQCGMVITADGIRRGGKVIPAKAVVDEALNDCPSVGRVLVARCAGTAVMMREGRDRWLHQEWEQVDERCAAEPMDAEDVLFILYTSGSTGKP